MIKIAILIFRFFLYFIKLSYNVFTLRYKGRDNFSKIACASVFILLFNNLSIWAQITSYPYEADFEFTLKQSGWSSRGTTSWEWGDPFVTNILTEAASGFYCWVTNKDSDYLNNENGWIESPEFDLTGLIQPKIEFSLWWYCEKLTDGAVFQYSIDGGNTWQNLGAFGDPNWFNFDDISSTPGNQTTGWTGLDDGYFGDYSGQGWTVMSHDLTNLVGQTSVFFRLAFASNSNNVSEGFGFDLFKLYDDAITFIPDVAFEQYLLDNLIDSDGVINGQVFKSDITSVSSLNITGYNISNFEGLQYFESITSFTLINNQTINRHGISFNGSNPLLQDITIINSPQLDYVFGLNRQTHLTDLTVVTNGDFLTNIYLPSSLVNATIAQNAISYLDSYYLDLPNLVSLNVAANPIEEIDLSGLPELQVLETYESGIKYLDLSNNKKLTRLNSDNGALLEVNLKNGFNNLLTSVELNNNAALSCIQVDDPDTATITSGWVKDTEAFYSDYCGYKIRTFPYLEDFESGIGNWQVVNNSNSSWQLGTPSSTNLNSAASGSNAWVTNLTGNYNSNESGWVESPVFDLTGIDPIWDSMYIQFDIWFQTESNADGAIFQSSIDGGNTWKNVGEFDPSYYYKNWYNDNIASLPGDQPIGWTGESTNIFSGGWKRATFQPFDLKGEPNVIFRIAFASNSSVENDGFAFDSFRIMSGSNPCYAGEDASYDICTVNENGNIPSLNLNNYLTESVDTSNGKWISLDGLQFRDEYEDSINLNEIIESGVYKFKFTTPRFGGDCYDESIIELNIEKKLSVGSNSEYYDNNLTEACSELTFKSDEVFQQWAFEKHATNNAQTVDPGGIWSPSTFQGYGTYTYTQLATSTCPETSSTFLYNRTAPLITSKYIETFNSGITNLYVLIDDFESNNGGKMAVVKKRRGKFKSNRIPVTDNGEVDFPNTGTGPYYEMYPIQYIIEDDCGSIESITNYTIRVNGGDRDGKDGILSICEGETFTEADLFDALEGNPTENPNEPGVWTPDISTGALGTYTYNYYESQSTEADFGFLAEGATVTVVNQPVLELSLFLQGPYNINTGWMNNALMSNNFIQQTSPYMDGVDMLVNDVSQLIVDWVWVELRDASNENNVPLQQSALLKRNGEVVDIDTYKPLLTNVPEGNYYVVVSHRNHLGVITANPVFIGCGTTTVDLRFDSSLVQGGTNAIKDMEDGSFVLYAGDFNGDGQIQNTDKSAVEPLRGISGYSNADLDMNGEVQNTDLNSVLNPNLGKGQQYTGKRLYAKRKK